MNGAFVGERVTSTWSLQHRTRHSHHDQQKHRYCSPDGPYEKPARRPFSGVVSSVCFAASLYCFRRMRHCRVADGRAASDRHFAGDRRGQSHFRRDENWDSPNEPPAVRYSVAITDRSWFDAQRGRTIPVRIYYPANAAERFPVVVFSTGLGRSRDDCAYLGRHWAGCGYVSVFVQHPGSDEAARAECGRGRDCSGRSTTPTTSATGPWT